MVTTEQLKHTIIEQQRVIREIRARRNALVEAVAGMFAAQDAWAQKGGASYPDWADGRARYDAARAEVDRLVADCKGEG